MIKRYDVYIQRNFDDDGCYLNYDENKTGKWVEFDDIKNLIPDNRVTEEDFKNHMVKNWNPYTYEYIFEYAKEKGWIKPEGEK